jgi:hypothetical protein
MAPDPNERIMADAYDNAAPAIFAGESFATTALSRPGSCHQPGSSTRKAGENISTL